MPLFHTCPANGWGSHVIRAEPQRATGENAHGHCVPCRQGSCPLADVIPAHRFLTLTASKIQRAALGCGIWNWYQPLPCRTDRLVGRQLIHRQKNQMIRTVISVRGLCRKEMLNPLSSSKIMPDLATFHAWIWFPPTEKQRAVNPYGPNATSF